MRVPAEVRAKVVNEGFGSAAELVGVEALPRIFRPLVLLQPVRVLPQLLHQLLRLLVLAVLACAHPLPLSAPWRSSEPSASSPEQAHSRNA